jgi:hypothetical protein
VLRAPPHGYLFNERKERVALISPCFIQISMLISLIYLKKTSKNSKRTAAAQEDGWFMPSKVILANQEQRHRAS